MGAILAQAIVASGSFIHTSPATILKEKGAAPTELEEEVAKALLDLEVAPQSDIKADLRDIYISNAQDVEVKNRTALVVHVPFRAWKSAKKVHGRLIRELEKKFSKKH